MKHAEINTTNKWSLFQKWDNGLLLILVTEKKNMSEFIFKKYNSRLGKAFLSKVSKSETIKAMVKILHKSFKTLLQNSLKLQTTFKEKRLTQKMYLKCLTMGYYL